MHTYIVTCKLPGGETVERRVRAPDHREAQRLLREAGMTEVVIIDRETHADRRMDRTTRSLLLALVIALPFGVAGVWWFYRRFCM